MATVCDECHKAIEVPEGSVTTGYGVDKEGRKVCFSCCAEHDKATMAEGQDPVLYLTEQKSPEGNGFLRRAEVSNWPGSLKFPAVVVARSKQYTPSGGQYDRVTAHFRDHLGRPWRIEVRGDMQCGRSRLLKTA
ncbi:MAG: hypothetical protein WC683_13125 [bacterium]